MEPLPAPLRIRATPRWGPLSAGVLAAGAAFVVLGVPTALIPSPLPFLQFKRMVDAVPLDYLLLGTTSALLGVYAYLYVSRRKEAKTGEQCSLLGGTVGGLFAFGCPICNQVLVGLFGVTQVATYFLPYRHWLGGASIALLGLAIYRKMETQRKEAGAGRAAG